MRLKILESLKEDLNLPEEGMKSLNKTSAFWVKHLLASIEQKITEEKLKSSSSSSL